MPYVLDLMLMEAVRLRGCAQGNICKLYKTCLSRNKYNMQTFFKSQGWKPLLFKDMVTYITCLYRCLVDEASQKSEMGPDNLHGSESSSHEHLGDATFPMNMSVSVADAGETAVVVSNINGNQQTEVPCENSILTVNTNKDLKIGMIDLIWDICSWFGFALKILLLLLKEIKMMKKGIK